MGRKGQVGAVGLLLIGALVGLGCNDGGVKGAKGGLVATPSLLNYGPVALQNEARIEVTVSNDGRAPFVVNELIPTVANLRVEGFDGPFTLPTGGVRKFTAVFSPAVEGPVTGAITVKTDDSGERNLQIFGVGVKSTVEINPDALDFGQVDNNTTTMQELTVHNPTGIPASVQMTVVGDNADEFSSTMFGAPIVVEAGESKQVPVAFSPVSLGIRSARVMAKVCES
ncbi:MAG: choice-of-anchor D domain-containing protein, partial [Myxococcaceae bacterium]